jgi:hypothetical protein
MMNLPKIEDLSGDTIDSKPVEFDFSTGYGETWDIVQEYPEDWTAEDCKRFLDDNGRDYDSELTRYFHDLEALMPDDATEELESSDTPEGLIKALDARLIDHTDEDSKHCTELRYLASEVLSNSDYNFPVMNYIYPLPSGDADRIRGKVNNLVSTTLIHRLDTDTYGLALTGGGMDFSIEICKSFIALGYMPPVHFCDLPRMSGFPSSRFDRLVIEACKESCRIAIKRIGFTIYRLESF